MLEGQELALEVVERLTGRRELGRADLLGAEVPEGAPAEFSPHLELGDAWVIVELMRDRGFGFGVRNDQDKDGVPGRVVIEFFESPSAPGVKAEGVAGEEAVLICRAALAALEAA